MEIDLNAILAITIAFGSWIITRLEIICRTQRKQLMLDRLAHPKLYDEIFGNRE